MSNQLQPSAIDLLIVDDDSEFRELLVSRFAQAARALGIDRRKLYCLLEKYAISAATSGFRAFAIQTGPALILGCDMH